MKALLSICIFFMSVHAVAQHKPHGTVYGNKPGDMGLMPASGLEKFMGNRTRIGATLSGRVVRVTKSKGGWFDLDAGKGKIISAHFKNYGITLPASLAGHQVRVQGTAQKTLISDDMQHFAGDKSMGQKQHVQKNHPTQRITFEVTGLMVER